MGGGAAEGGQPVRARSNRSQLISCKVKCARVKTGLVNVCQRKTKSVVVAHTHTHTHIQPSTIGVSIPSAVGEACGQNLFFTRDFCLSPNGLVSAVHIAQSCVYVYFEFCY